MALFLVNFHQLGIIFLGLKKKNCPKHNELEVSNLVFGIFSCKLWNEEQLYFARNFKLPVT